MSIFGLKKCWGVHEGGGGYEKVYVLYSCENVGMYYIGCWVALYLCYTANEGIYFILV